MAFQINDTIGDYKIVGPLGSGGMGAVYRVRNILTDRDEAMKVLLPDLNTTPELTERFGREIRIQASLEHPHIAGLRTAIRVNNQLLMIMELVEGETLEQHLRKTSIHPSQATHWVRQVLLALSYAHGRGVIHRDIKPANIMLTAAGIVKLTDFGVASMAAQNRLTRSGMGIGSLHYMSPEQINAGHVDARSDIYSLGVTFYQMLGGRRPFERASEYELMKAHCEQEPPPLLSLNPALPHELPIVVSRAMAKDPAQRFQTAEEFTAALGFGSSADPVTVFPPATPVDSIHGRIPSGALGPASNFDPARIDRVRTELAQYVGPMARVLVNRAIRNAATLQQLYDALAVEIPNVQDQQRFLAHRPR